MNRTIELHVVCTSLPVGLAADLGKAMAKVDKNARFGPCEEHDDDRDCRFVFTAEVTE